MVWNCNSVSAAHPGVCFPSSGLSLTGSHLMCGDFLYSGHTVMLTLSYLFIKECQFYPVLPPIPPRGGVQNVD